MKKRSAQGNVLEKYFERALEFLTPQGAQNLNGAAGLAGWQVQVLRRAD